MAVKKKPFTKLQCKVCKNFNYFVNKSKGKTAASAEEKLELNKFCNTCKKHTVHKEAKK